MGLLSLQGNSLDLRKQFFLYIEILFENGIAYVYKDPIQVELLWYNFSSCYTVILNVTQIVNFFYISMEIKNDC